MCFDCACVCCLCCCCCWWWCLQVSQLWKDVVTKLGADEFPDVELSHMYIDNAAMQLIRNPKYFDVIVTGEGGKGGAVLVGSEARQLAGQYAWRLSAGRGGPGEGSPSDRERFAECAGARRLTCMFSLTWPIGLMPTDGVHLSVRVCLWPNHPRQHLW